MRSRQAGLRVLVLAGLASLVLLPGASGQSLWSRLRSTDNRKAAVQEHLRDVKAEQATRRNTLVSTQRRARQAKAAYYAAKDQLEVTRASLRKARKEHQECCERLEKHDALVCHHVKAMYEMGEPSYVEVLLDASSFSDFVERADYMKRVAQQDSALLVQYVEDKKEAEKLRSQLEADEAREAKLTREQHERKAAYESEAAKAETLLRQANSEREAAERQLAELDRASKEIEEMLRNLQTGRSGSSLRYGGKWSGWGSAPIGGGYRISSRYGWRDHPITGRRSFHDGVDLACGSGTRIHAAANGRVVHAGWYGPYGIAVIVDHGSGWSTLYGHCSSVGVGPGQTVSAGQVVGYVGSTGYSTGPHLHYSVRKYGKPVSPGGAY